MTLFFVGKLSPGNFHGNMIAIASGVAFAAFLLGMRKNGARYQAASIFWGNVLIVLVCSFSLFNGLQLNARELGIAAYLGIFQIGFAYAAFTYGLKRVEAVEASLISMIEPVLNPVWVFFGYGEAPSVFAIVGGVLIVTVIGIRTFIVERARV
jgi:drug/metabolite transporter (DMT)-like permease